MIYIIDIDDCLMPWGQPVHEACEAAGITGGKPWVSWHMWEDYGCMQQQWLDVVESLTVVDGIYHAPPYPGAAEALRRAEWEGHEIHLVTARGFMAHAEEIRQWTAEWKEGFAIPGTLTFAKDKDRVARELGATHAVDDGVHNFEMLDQVDGLEVFLLNQPHNASAPVPEHRRVNSVAEFITKTLEAA